MHDLISRRALCEYALNQKDKSVTPNDIMRFPSAQPEQDEEFIKLTVRNSNGRPYYSIIYLVFDDNGVGHDLEGYSSYSLDVISDYLKKYFISSAQPEIISCGQGELVQDCSRLVQDLISRQVATQTALDFIVEYLGGAFDEDFQKKLMERMNALPSAQSETHDKRTETHGVCLDTISRQAAIDTLNVRVTIGRGNGKSVAFKIANDYADIVKKRIEALPSAQPTDADIQKMQDIEQAMLEKAYECGKQDAAQWIPCSERLPDKPNVYTVTDHEGRVVRYAYYDNESSREYWKRCAKAWMPLPEPYVERKTDETN